MNPQIQAIRHFTNIAILYAGITGVLQLGKYLTLMSARPEWMYWLLWSPLIVSLASLLIALKFIYKDYPE